MRCYNRYRPRYRGWTVLLFVEELMTYICSIMENDNVFGDVQSQPSPENMEVSKGLYKGKTFTRSLIYYVVKKLCANLHYTLWIQ